MLAPGRSNAVVEVRARSSHVQLLLIGLGGNVIPGLCPLGQELRQMESKVKDGIYEQAGRVRERCKAINVASQLFLL